MKKKTQRHLNLHIPIEKSSNQMYGSFTNEIKKDTDQEMETKLDPLQSNLSSIEPHHFIRKRNNSLITLKESTQKYSKTPKFQIIKNKNIFFPKKLILENDHSISGNRKSVETQNSFIEWNLSETKNEYNKVVQNDLGFDDFFNGALELMSKNNQKLFIKIVKLKDTVPSPRVHKLYQNCLQFLEAFDKNVVLKRSSFSKKKYAH